MDDCIRSTLCYIENNGCYLMLCRDRKKNDMNEGKWLGIGGKIEDGETPDECNYREVLEEAGLVLKRSIFHGVIRFRSDEYPAEDMYLYSSDSFEPADPEAADEFRRTGIYALPECDEGGLAWIEKSDVLDLPLWEGDKIFLRMLIEGQKNISMTLKYTGDKCTVSDLEE